MNFSQRLLAGSVALLAVLVLAIVIIAGGRLNTRLATDTEDNLGREARLVGIAWSEHPSNPDSLANASGAALQHRVTLIDTSGVVLGDSQFDGAELHALQNHSTRPEVARAREAGVGIAIRSSASAGDDEMYVAIRHVRGYVRVSLSTARFHEIVRGAQRDVLMAAGLALLGAILAATLFSRRISRPIVELRDVTRAIAAGDLARRASLSAPGEVGDLAVAVHRMADELSSRLTAIEAEDALLLAIIEALDEGIIAVDASGVVVRMNEAARRLFATRQLLPFSISNLGAEHAIHDAVVRASHGEAVTGRETMLGDRIVSLTARPLIGGGAVLAALDLTERRRLETVRRDFVANVSHELKTPLTVIGGFAETLRDAELTADERARFVDLVLSNTTRMQRIVDDLLDLSRYESTSWVPRRSRIDVAAAIEEVLAPMRASATAHQILLGELGRR